MTVVLVRLGLLYKVGCGCKKRLGGKNKQEAEIVSKSYYLDPWYLNLFFCERGIVIFLP
jgi:hypothetical protein